MRRVFKKIIDNSNNITNKLSMAALNSNVHVNTKIFDDTGGIQNFPLLSPSPPLQSCYDNCPLQTDIPNNKHIPLLVYEGQPNPQTILFYFFV
jgi:hypothetical protein